MIVTNICVSFLNTTLQDTIFQGIKNKFLKSSTLLKYDLKVTYKIFTLKINKNLAKQEQKQS